MKLTKHLLFEMIEETLLTEIFDTTNTYPYTMQQTKYTKLSDEDGYGEGYEEYEMITTYEFTAQKDGEREFPYTVKFEAESDEMEIEVDFKANATWDMTNQMDLKVYSTIVAIIKHFTLNIRPSLNYPFSQITKFRAIAAYETKGDTRRARIYSHMLTKMGALNVGPGQWNKNEIRWEVML